jgi:hypothetical protein
MTGCCSPLWLAAAAKPPPKEGADAGVPNGAPGDAGAPKAGALGKPKPGVAGGPNAGIAGCPKPAQQNLFCPYLICCRNDRVHLAYQALT